MTTTICTADDAARIMYGRRGGMGAMGERMRLTTDNKLNVAIVVLLAACFTLALFNEWLKGQGW